MKRHIVWSLCISEPTHTREVAFNTRSKGDKPGQHNFHTKQGHQTMLALMDVDLPHLGSWVGFPSNMHGRLARPN